MNSHGGGNVELKLQRLHPRARRPQYMSQQAAGMDLFAVVDDAPLWLQPQQRCMVATGWALALPAGYEAQVRPRSGLAWKQGLTLLNSPGTIDSDYRGEIKVIVVNHGDGVAAIEDGQCIAQLVIAPVVQASLKEVSSLEDTLRGEGGFGHTGH